MADIRELAAWGGIVVIGGYFGVVFWKLMTGSISLDGLLHGDARTRNGVDYSTFFSAGRAQMLMFTVIFAMYFLLQVIQNPTKFPEVPDAVLVVLGGSHAIYLGGKAQALYLGRLRDLADLLERRKP